MTATGRRIVLKTLALAALVVGLAVVAEVAGADDDDGNAGFQTAQAPMLEALAPSASVTPIMTVGETLASGYRFEAIPDGISIRRRGKGRVDIYLNHETSTVPFPFNPATGVGFNDFTNALVSRLVLNRRSAGVLRGSYVIPSEANYQRFCSNFLATREHGFEFDLLLTNEEATDFVNRTGTAWPAGPGAEQAGVVVAYDIKRKRFRTIYGMGRHNHENSVAIPGYRHPVVLSGDDTFNAPGSQLYMYQARSAAALWRDQGKLYAFRSDNPAINDYGDLLAGMSVSGTFIEVPRAIAVGDQTGLESWSNANNVFQFIRIEDTAYDRNSPNVIYLADTGEPRAIPDAVTGRLRRGPSGTLGPYMNGRIFRMELDRGDPTIVTSLSVLIDADLGGYNNVNVMHQPDNLETTRNSLLIQEDPGSHNHGQTTARIWRYNLVAGTLEVVARVDQSADEGPTDVDPTPAGAPGVWESSGIIDASSAFGPGAFLVDIQAPTLIVEREVRGTLTYEREGGQLLLLRLPGEETTTTDDEDEGDD